jgi:hypothetical protein
MAQGWDHLRDSLREAAAAGVPTVIEIDDAAVRGW